MKAEAQEEVTRRKHPVTVTEGMDITAMDMTGRDKADYPIIVQALSLQIDIQIIKSAVTFNLLATGMEITAYGSITTFRFLTGDQFRGNILFHLRTSLLKNI